MDRHDPTQPYTLPQRRQVFHNESRPLTHGSLFPLSEQGDAEFFAEHFGHRVKYDHRQERWLIFRGHRWIGDAGGELHRLGVESIRKRQDHAGAVQDETRSAQIKWVHAGESRARLENMIALAKYVRPISDDGTGWDDDPWLLGVLNGVVDIRTGVLRAGTPEDRITMTCRARFDPGASCPEWEATVARVFGNDDELMLYVQCALGYSLTGIVNEQCLFLNTGSGSNGKGTVLNTVGTLLHDYAANLPFSSLETQAKGAIGNDIAGIVGKRFVTASEPKKGLQLDDARIKTLTGCDPITVRRLYHENFTFQPSAKFWLSCNDKPLIDDSSYGMWRRIRVVPWDAQFKDERNDKELKQRLEQEFDGILNWLVDGCVHGWRKMGLRVPEVIQNATKEYESESDVLTLFKDERLATGDSRRIGGGQLYREYLDWVASTTKRPMSAKFFGIWAKKQWKTETSHNLVTYLGVSLQSG